MKLRNLLTLAIAAIVFFTACQKALDLNPDGVSVGTLKTNITGTCTPNTIVGIYKVDSVLSNANYVDVEVNITVAGTFEVRSDTVNGFSFYKKGTVGTGSNVIRLYASGKPITAGTNNFTITYGSDVCSFSITVFGSIPGGGTALYTLGGSPGNCSVSSINGSYIVGQAMTPANTVEMTVNVTNIGTYNITGATVNGVSFNASGSFINPGVQNIFLTASGTPTAAGNFNYPVTNSVTTCNFNVTYTGGTPAVYILGGSPGNCTNVALTGTYMAGTSTSAANTVKVDVNVSTAGSYSLSTPTVNGIKFAAAGIFTSTGPQTVTLTANTAIPPGSGPFNYTISGAATTCTFTVTYAPAPPPASFTLSGDPGSCLPVTVNGTYQAGTALTASHNVEVEVNVTVAGAYTISTNTVNGMQFSKSGVFSTTGLQNVTLAAVAGSNPAAAGTSTLTPMAGTTSCTFDITVAAPSDLVYSFRIGATTFSGPCSAFLFGAGGSETINIYDPTPSRLDMDLTNATGAVTAGFYSGTSTAGKYAQFSYNGIQYASFPGSGLTNLSATITSINAATRIVEGTFSGTVINASATVFTITNGVFKADF